MWVELFNCFNYIPMTGHKQCRILKKEMSYLMQLSKGAVQQLKLSSQVNNDIQTIQWKPIN